MSDPPSAEPLVVVNQWLAESWRLRQQPNPNAMVLATVSPEGAPSARVVLCKEIVAQPGYLVFYTNYRSRKARELLDQPRAAAVMHWDHLHRQARIEGPVVQSPAADSDAYFASRPWQSRLSAWASEQSEPIAARRDLEAALAAAAKRFGTPVPAEAGNASAGMETAGVGTAPAGDYVIPRPPHWGGLQLWAQSVELWVEGDARIHDRLRWTRSLAPSGEQFFAGGPWTVTRLQP
ncbi:MAG TPA: pyridoxal 5'-phosphate synthase [Steroidobacteraceae bacterium]